MHVWGGPAGQGHRHILKMKLQVPLHVTHKPLFTHQPLSIKQRFKQDISASNRLFRTHLDLPMLIRMHEIIGPGLYGQQKKLRWENGCHLAGTCFDKLFKFLGFTASGFRGLRGRHCSPPHRNFPRKPMKNDDPINDYHEAEFVFSMPRCLQLNTS